MCSNVCGEFESHTHGIDIFLYNCAFAFALSCTRQLLVEFHVFGGVRRANIVCVNVFDWLLIGCLKKLGSHLV